MFIKSQLDYADGIYEQAYNSSFHEKLESLLYSACFAITGEIRRILSEKLYQEIRIFVNVFDRKPPGISTTPQVARCRKLIYLDRRYSELHVCGT